MATTPSNSSDKKLTKAPSPTVKKTVRRVKTQSPSQSTTTRVARPSTAKKATPKTSAAPAKAATTAVSTKPAQAGKTDALKTKTNTVKAKAIKEKKVKVMRDSFTIPKTEFNQIGELKKRAVMMGIEVKKSELIRAGLLLINGLTDVNFKQALSAVPTVKTGRPSKD